MTRVTHSDSELASALRIGVMRLARRLRAERLDTALTLTQISALATTERDGPLTPGALAALEKVQPPSMTRVVATLEGRGLMAREPHPTDGRQVLLRVTDSGRGLLRDDRRRREAWLAEHVADLSADERDLLLRALPVLDRLARA